MKKTCLILISLLLTFNGYSQIRKISYRDALIPVQMQMSSRIEDTDNLQNVQSSPNSLRTDGELDYSTYDWQTNAAARTWTHVWDDGKISFAYTIATNTSYSDRGTGIGLYNSNTGVWTHKNGRVENEKTGFGSIARYGSNGLVIASHTANQCGIYIATNKDNINTNSLSAVSYLNNTYEPAWPAVMTSGTNRNIIHVVAVGRNNNRLYYFRSQNGGQTWDKANVVLPYTGTNYCSYWNSNTYYWMETTDDNCLTLVVNNPWSDGMVIYSYDNGETWQRKVFWHHPGINTTFGGMVLYPRWTSCQWDNNHKLHVLYEFNGTTGEPGSGSYYPGIGGVAYWNETMPYRGYGVQYGFDPTNPNPPVHGQPFIMDSAYLFQDIYASWWLWSDASHEMWPEYVGYLTTLDDYGNWENPYDATSFNIQDRSLHGSYNSGICAFPVLCKVPNSNGLIAVWSAMDENNTDGNGNYYYKLFAAYSSNGGQTWSNMVHLTNSFNYQNSECVYPQAAIANNQLIIAVQMDAATGTNVMNSDTDPDPYDNYYQGLTFDLQSLFGITPTQNYTITATANPTNGGTVTGAGTYAQGSTCTLHATANSGYSFVKWTRNGTQVSTNPNYSFTVTGNAAYVAHFQQNTTNYTITATASPSNAGTITGAGSYASGSTCTLRATPNSGYRFVNWLENSTSVSTNATYSFTVTSNRNLVAVFDVAPTYYTITATANPSNGGTVTGGGSYASGSTCTLHATPNSGYSFEKWTKNGTQVSTNPDYSFTVTSNASYVAHFSEIPQEYTITAVAEPAQGGAVSGAGIYPAGSTCVLTAMPNEGYVFENWTRGSFVVSTDPSYSFVVNDNVEIVAHFTQDANHFTITAIAAPIEGGAISGSGTYEMGTTCTLNAIAAVGYEFVKWTLNGSQVSTEPSFSFIVTSNAVYTAHFERIINHYTVAASVEPAAAGSVSGTGTYQEGATCTLTATANPTYSFVNWTENGVIVSTNHTYSFTVNSNRSFVATFSQGQFFTITASASDNGTISPEGDVFVEPGADKTFAMIPNSGCRVGRVIVDGVDIGPVESYTFRSVNSNHSIYVQFSGVGVDENQNANLKVYPNPAKESLVVEGEDMKRVAVFNLLGVQMASQEVNDSHTTINTNGFIIGTYILKVEYTDGKIGYSRFVVAE